MNQDVKLQVLICTLGKAGIDRVVKGIHPAVPGVEYRVSWQLPDGDIDIPEELGQREDFNVFKNCTRGLSKNRNIAIDLATAPYCLISDDDLDYFEDGLLQVIKTFDNNPDLDIAAFRYSGNDRKYYPDSPFDLRNPPKGWFITSFEIAFRRDKIIDTGILFNENFGIGAKFPAGEENIWMHDLLRKKLTGLFYPVTVAHHAGLTTGLRLADDPQFIMTKGAVFAHIHPFSWPLRMIVHAWRHRKNGYGLSVLSYIRFWINGIIMINSLSFKTSDIKINTVKSVDVDQLELHQR